MKRKIAIAFGVAVCAVAGAVAAREFADRVIDLQHFQAGFLVHPASIANSTTNKVTRMLAASASLDFAANDSICEDLPIALTGAQPGDSCIVGAPTAYGTGASMFSCYVSDAGFVNVRHCPNNSDGGSNPSPGTYRVRVISNQ